METIIGIDLGTTNSVVSIIKDGKPIILTDNDNGILPSVVGLDRSESLLVGMEARNQMLVAPEKTVASVKRLMGSDKKVSMGDKEFRPQEISAAILRHLKQRAEKELQKPIRKAVITVPAYFTDSQRQATKEAGEIAGLEVVRIINEPTAAALAYEQGDGESRKVLVFDLGGGTFDVSVVHIENGVVEVMASTGDNFLGGDDFDRKLAAHLAEVLKEEQEADVEGIPQATARLLRAAEEAKIALSTAPYTKISLDHLIQKEDTPIHFTHELARMDFEDMIREDIERTMEAVSRALNDAGILASDLDKILLVGGSTRIPMISRLLEERLGHLPHSEVDPDLCVALGAGIQAGREMGIETSTVLIDITPYTFGTSSLGYRDGELYEYCYVPLIRRNTKLPASRSDVFTTVVPYQKQIEILVYQGENSDATENTLIGKYMFELTPQEEQAPIIFRYDLDVNGILKIRAEEKATGHSLEAVIENAFSQDALSIAGSRERMETLWGEEESPDQETMEEEAPDLPSDIQEILEDAKSKLDRAAEEDKDEIINLMEDLRQAVKEKRMDDAEDIRMALEDILFYID
ncbi:Hsp70 family protein [Desulfobotulus mexicanus]|uniref:Hsp70 family protein n=1 Tax=Desulfobotulus mexicanus TaxID=2586642 RepID=A0A5S5MED3_9BACT|nr:Hsp70 family protein [Desulfobotulus mexicanus]TYT73985.1 Hsp70 family protein [Desulfobotulus mexicanus]